MKDSGVNDCAIVVLDGASAPFLRLKAEELIRQSPYAHCYFDPQNPKNPHVFLASLNGNFIGFLLMDILHHDCTVPREKIRTVGAEIKVPIEEPIWSIVCVWIKPEFQGKKIGKRLCVEGCSFWKTTPNEVGWSRPISAAGEALLKSLGVDSAKLIC
jgi:ribosomal protein S18 acetylase RimI-like enzyme